MQMAITQQIQFYYIMFQVFFQYNSLLYHHLVYPVRCQLLRPAQHPEEIQHNHHLKNLLGDHFFYQVLIPAGNHHRAVVQWPLCWKDCIPVENQCISLLKNQLEYLPWGVARVLSLVEIHQLLSACIPVVYQLLHQPHIFHIFEARKPITIQAFVHYSLQLVWKVWFHIFNLVTSHTMIQVCTQAVDQLMRLSVFQYFILASTLVYQSHKPHPSLPVSISVPYPVVMHQLTVHIKVLDTQYSEKPSQLPSSVFITIPSILLSQQPNLSSSGLPNEMPMITPNTTPSRDPTQSPSNKVSWFSSFLPSANPRRKPS